MAAILPTGYPHPVLLVYGREPFRTETNEAGRQEQSLTAFTDKGCLLCKLLGYNSTTTTQKVIKSKRQATIKNRRKNIKASFECLDEMRKANKIDLGKALYQQFLRKVI